MSCSDKQRAANAANARGSTGPRTDAGKRRSSRNAITHGVFCRADVLLPGESAAEMAAVRTAMVQELNPQTLAEAALVDRVVSALWKVNRLERAEGILHRDARDDDRRAFARELIGEVESHTRRLSPQNGRTDDDDDEPDRREPRFGDGFGAAEWPNEPTGADGDTDGVIDVDPDADPADQAWDVAHRLHIPASATTVRLLADGGGGLEKIDRLIHRLETQVLRLLRELQRLQVHGRKVGRELPPGPYGARTVRDFVADVTAAAARDAAAVVAFQAAKDQVAAVRAAGERVGAARKAVIDQSRRDLMTEYGSNWCFHAPPGWPDSLFRKDKAPAAPAAAGSKTQNEPTAADPATGKMQNEPSPTRPPGSDGPADDPAASPDRQKNPF